MHMRLWISVDIVIQGDVSVESVDEAVTRAWRSFPSLAG